MAARALASAIIAAPEPAAARALRPAKASKPAPFTSNGTISKTTAMMGEGVAAGLEMLRHA